MPYLPNPGLPDPLYRALTESDYDSQADYSVTTLISPPQLVQLQRRHGDNLTFDARDNFHLFLGTAVHDALERKARETNEIHEIAEIRMFEEIDGVKISAKPDLFVTLNDGVLVDYKLLKVASLKSSKTDYEIQLNCYAYFLRKRGYEVNRLMILPMLKDHSKTRARLDPSYPAHPVDPDGIEFRVWSIDETESYIRERIRLHEQAARVPDDQLPPCSDQERWMRHEYHVVERGAAVYKPSVYKTRYWAEKRLEKLGDDFTILVVRGEPIRCKDFCPARSVCVQAFDILS